MAKKPNLNRANLTYRNCQLSPKICNKREEIAGQWAKLPTEGKENENILTLWIHLQPGHRNTK